MRGCVNSENVGQVEELLLMTEQMQNAVQLSVPLVAEAKTGASWYEAK